MISGRNKRPQEKFPSIHQVFAQVPGQYDWMNLIITGGLDKGWRRKAAEECLAPFSWGSPKKILDLCCGTGDLSLLLAKQTGGACEIIGADYSQAMLDIAACKGARQKLAVQWTQADAAQLPFADGYFDCLGISFGFRNLTFRNQASLRHLAEMVRVLRPGGRLVVLETSQPENQWIRGGYYLYLKVAVKFLGSLLANNSLAYGYLADSARNFFGRSELEKLLKEAGFSGVCSQSRLCGAIAISVATK